MRFVCFINSKTKKFILKFENINIFRWREQSNRNCEVELKVKENKSIVVPDETNVPFKENDFDVKNGKSERTISQL